MPSPGSVSFQYLYQVAPITLTGGIASQMPGGALSIVSFLQSSAFSSVLGFGTLLDLDDAFAQYIPLPGGTIIDQEIGAYPFANQQTAANAIITKPLTISFRMICPATEAMGYSSKQAVMTSLQGTLNQHNLLGGLYTLATPAFVYIDCVMLQMRDISPPVDENSNQPQVMWQLDFIQPLVTLQQAQQAQNILLSKISSGTQLTPNSSGVINASGAASSVGNPASGQSPAVSPAAQGPGQGFSASTVGSAALPHASDAI